jgi:hypothetical protein
MTYLQAIENMGCANGMVFPGGAMFFVFIVQISNLLKTGSALVRPMLSITGQRRTQDASRTHRIGL